MGLIGWGFLLGYSIFSFSLSGFVFTGWNFLLTNYFISTLLVLSGPWFGTFGTSPSVTEARCLKSSDLLKNESCNCLETLSTFIVYFFTACASMILLASKKPSFCSSSISSNSSIDIAMLLSLCLWLESSCFWFVFYWLTISLRFLTSFSSSSNFSNFSMSYD